MKKVMKVSICKITISNSIEFKETVDHIPILYRKSSFTDNVSIDRKIENIFQKFKNKFEIG